MEKRGLLGVAADSLGKEWLRQSGEDQSKAEAWLWAEKALDKLQ